MGETQSAEAKSLGCTNKIEAKRLHSPCAGLGKGSGRCLAAIQQYKLGQSWALITLGCELWGVSILRGFTAPLRDNRN